MPYYTYHLWAHEAGTSQVFREPKVTAAAASERSVFDARFTQGARTLPGPTLGARVGSDFPTLQGPRPWAETAKGELQAAKSAAMRQLLGASALDEPIISSFQGVIHQKLEVSVTLGLKEQPLQCL